VANYARRQALVHTCGEDRFDLSARTTIENGRGKVNYPKEVYALAHLVWAQIPPVRGYPDMDRDSLLREMDRIRDILKPILDDEDIPFN